MARANPTPTLDDLLRRARRKKKGRWNLDATLLDFGEGDTWPLRDACEATGVWGAPGAGKSSLAGRRIALAFLRAGMGGLWLTTKASDRKEILSICAEAGRLNDVIEMSPQHHARYNFLDDLAQASASEHGSMTENVVHLLREVMSLFRPTGMDADDGIWSEARDDMIRNAVDLLLLADEPITLTNILELVQTAPESPSDVQRLRQLTQADQTRPRHPRAEFSYFEKLWINSASRSRDGVRSLDRHSVQRTISFFTSSWARMPEKTRGSVKFTFESMASPLTRGALAELLCTTTNVTPADVLRGRIWLVSLPVKVFHAGGAAAQAIVKTMVQRAIEQRGVEAKNQDIRPAFVWIDEYQNFATRGDLSFLATARGARACTMLMTQNLASIRERLGADACENLMGLVGTKIFMRNGCPETNQWAARIIGEDWRYSANVSSDGSASFQRVRQDLVDPIEFTRLGIGEAYVHKAGAGWRSGTTNHLKARFRR